MVSVKDYNDIIDKMDIFDKLRLYMKFYIWETGTLKYNFHIVSNYKKMNGFGNPDVVVNENCGIYYLGKKIPILTFEEFISEKNRAGHPEHGTYLYSTGIYEFVFRLLSLQYEIEKYGKANNSLYSTIYKDNGGFIQNHQLRDIPKEATLSYFRQCT